MGCVRLVTPILIDQLWLPDASRRAGSAGVSAALPEFHLAKGWALRPEA